MKMTPKTSNFSINERFEKILNNYESDWKKLNPIVNKLTKLAEFFCIDDDDVKCIDMTRFKKDFDLF